MENYRILRNDRDDNRHILDEHSVANGYLNEPTKVNSLVTFTMGLQSDMLPLTFLTEGQKGGVKEIDSVDGQYVWDTMGRPNDLNKVITSAYTTAGTHFAGINGSIFYVVFETEKFIIDHTVTSPNGFMCRIMQAPERIGNNFRYALRLIDPEPSSFVPVTEFVAGSSWVQGAAVVSMSKSKGNASTIMTPGQRTNQIMVLRKSYEIAGNIANAPMKKISVKTGDGTFDMFMSFAEWQFTMQWKQYQEEMYWWSIYNRNNNGHIILKDETSGEPIPMGAGIDQIISQANYSTYGEVMPLQLLKSAIGDLFYGVPGKEKMEVVLYGGQGFLEDIDEAIKNPAGQYLTPLGEKMIGGATNSSNLIYGAYFNRYITPAGHVISFVHLPILDYGQRANLDIANGNVHPRTGYPLCSHSAYFIDHTAYNGIKNVQMMTQKGRSIIRGVVKGMSPLPGSWKSMAGNNESLATDQDKSSIHFLSAKGVNINNDYHCLKLACVL